MANSKGTHRAKHLIEDERKLHRDQREEAEDQAARGLRQRIFEGVERTQAILGHLRTGNWMKQGKKDARNR